MKSAGIALIVIAGMAFVIAVKSVIAGFNGGGSEDIANFSGVAVGSFLVPIFLLAVGLHLLKKG
jgi:hypothetical protein